MLQTALIQLRFALFCVFFMLLFACSSTQESTETKVTVTFEQVSGVLSHSCMPCHHRQILPQLIDKVRSASFAEIEGEPRTRILHELEGLLADILSGAPLDYSRVENLQRNFQGMPGEFYNVLEKGVMPPPWAAELMKQLQWPYTPLSPEHRVLLLQFAKPSSQKYLR